MNLCRNPWVLRWLLLPGAAMAVSCSPGAPVAGSNPTPDTPVPRAAPDSLPVVLATCAEALAGYPDHPEAEQALARLLAVLPQEDPETRLETVLRFAQQPLGVKLLESECATLPESERSRLLDSIRSRAPQSPLRAAALKYDLDRLSEQDPDAFLARCGVTIDAGESTEAERAVALYARAVFHRDSGRARAAAADALRLAAEAPERVQRMRAQPVLAAMLREAGCLLEADMIEAAEDPGPVARSLHRQLEPLWTVVDGAAAREGADPHLLAYLRHAPDYRAVEAAAPADPTASLPSLAFASRLQRLALRAGDIDAALHYSRLLIDGYAALPDEVPLEGDEAVLCAAQLDANVDSLKRNLMDPDFVPHGSGRSHRSFASAATDRTLVTLSLLSYRLKAQLAGTGPGAASRVAAATENHVAVLKMTNDTKGVIEAYRRFVERHADAPEAPEFLMKIAECYRSLKAPRNAADAFGEVASRYPDCDQYETAVLNRLLCLYEAEDYEPCFEEAETFCADRTDSPQVPVAQLLKGLSLAALDMKEDAVACLEDIVRQFPASSAAPRALMWLASQHLAESDYDAARKRFQDLRDRYPRSDEARRAAEYLERLQAVAAQDPS